MINVTKIATIKVIELMKRKNLPEGTILKIGLKGGGCSGFEYIMNFVEDPDEKDRTFEFYGLKVCIDTKSYLFMSGTTLDFNDDLMNSGFQFKNPNATGECGCGKSVAF